MLMSASLQNNSMNNPHVSDDDDDASFIITLDATGAVTAWGEEAELFRYKSHEILGQNFSIFYLPEDRQRGLPQQLLEHAFANGSATFKGLLLRKNGSSFIGNIIITAQYNDKKKVISYTSRVTKL